MHRIKSERKKKSLVTSKQLTHFQTFLAYGKEIAGFFSF
jgi:hypothetical protein